MLSVGIVPGDDFYSLFMGRTFASSTSVLFCMINVPSDTLLIEAGSNE